VAPLLDEEVQHDPILVDRPPQPVSLALDLQQQLVAVPRVARPCPPLAQPGCEGWAELVTPLPNALVADDQAAFGEQVLHITEAEMETVVQPDGVGDDRGWKR